MAKDRSKNSDAELLAEYNQHMTALDKMTDGLGHVAYIRANTARKAFQELVDRGRGHLIEGYQPQAIDTTQKAGHV